MQALHKQMRKCAIPSRHEFLVTKLLTGNEERIAGVISVDFQTGEIIHIAAKTVILATGGGGDLYPVNSNTPDATGNGAVLALDAGADLVDMEFILMLGHAVLHPQTVRGVLFTFQYLLPKGAQLPFNSLNEAFLAKYDPDGSDNPPRNIYIPARSMAMTRQNRVLKAVGVAMRWDATMPCASRTISARDRAIFCASTLHPR